MSGTFTEASVAEYVAWLNGYVASGGEITHFYDYPFSRAGILVALADFTTAGECGSASRNIIVRPGVRHLGGDLGHCNLYYEDGYRTQGGAFPFVPAYSNAEFTDVPGWGEGMAARRRERAEQEAEREARKAPQSDLSDYTGAARSRRR